MKPALTAVFVLGVAGCTVGNTEENFLCGAVEGQPCASLSEVDGSGAGASTRSLAERPEDSRSATLSQSPLFGGKPLDATVAGLGDGGAPYQSSRYRIPEKTGALWIAPRLDDQAILYEATYVHFVIREASWGNR